MIEVLFDGVSQEARLPETTEHMLEFREARDQRRMVDGPAQSAADERGARGAETRDRLIGTVFILDSYAQAARRHYFL